MKYLYTHFPPIGIASSLHTDTLTPKKESAGERADTRRRKKEKIGKISHSSAALNTRVELNIFFLFFSFHIFILFSTRHFLTFSLHPAQQCSRVHVSSSHSLVHRRIYYLKKLCLSSSSLWLFNTQRGATNSGKHTTERRVKIFCVFDREKRERN